MSDFTNVGNEVGGFLGGILTPTFGTSTTTQIIGDNTTTPTSSTKPSTTMVAIILIVLVIAGVFIFLKSKKTA